jgi:hypothetical protein
MAPHLLLLRSRKMPQKDLVGIIIMYMDAYRIDTLLSAARVFNFPY